MAANTFLECTRSLRLYVQQLPITLAEHFIRDRYRRILERRDWSALRREAEFILNDAKTTGTVAVTRESLTVTGTGTTFASTDVGRQFKVGSSPVYTIAAVDTGAQTLTLDRAYGDTTDATAEFTIFDGYVTVPTDFLRFIYIVDPNQGFRLRHWITSSELSKMDPQRLNFGQPYVLADRMFNSAGTLPQYEVWPYNTSARTLYYTYIKRGADLSADTDIPIWPLRSDVIVAGALADVARWPGTADEPNPYFTRPEYWKMYESEFEDKMIELERRDEDVYMTQLQVHPEDLYPLAPMSTNWSMNHL